MRHKGKAAWSRSHGPGSFLSWFNITDNLVILGRSSLYIRLDEWATHILNGLGKERLGKGLAYWWLIFSSLSYCFMATTSAGI